MSLGLEALRPHWIGSYADIGCDELLDVECGAKPKFLINQSNPLCLDKGN